MFQDVSQIRPGHCYGFFSKRQQECKKCNLLSKDCERKTMQKKGENEMKQNILTPKTPNEKIVFDRFHAIKKYEELNGRLPPRITLLGRWMSNMRDIKQGYRKGRVIEILQHLCNRYRKHYFDVGVNHKQKAKKAKLNTRRRGVMRDAQGINKKIHQTALQSLQHLNPTDSLIDYSVLAKDLNENKKTLNFDEIRKMLFELEGLSSRLVFLQDSVLKTKEAFQIFLKTFNQLDSKQVKDTGAIDYEQLMKNLK